MRALPAAALCAALCATLCAVLCSGKGPIHRGMRDAAPSATAPARIDGAAEGARRECALRMH